MSFAHGLPDYNGHYGIRELYDICPLRQLDRCTEASESGFETKAAALTWGRDQEARIREGRWTDPNTPTEPGKDHRRLGLPVPDGHVTAGNGADWRPPCVWHGYI